MPFSWSNAGERSRPGGRRVVRAVGLLVGVVTLGAVGVSTIGSAADVDPIASAWERAAASGINLNVGVGDARIRGGEVLDSESAFISKSIRAQGSGDKDLEVDLGVGDVSIRLN